MAKTWPPKDPDEVLDYQIDWTDRLAGDTIVSSAWTITGDDDLLVQDSDTINDPKTTVWLSVGTLNKNYTLTNPDHHVGIANDGSNGEAQDQVKVASHGQAEGS